MPRRESVHETEVRIARRYEMVPRLYGVAAQQYEPRSGGVFDSMASTRMHARYAVQAQAPDREAVREWRSALGSLRPNERHIVDLVLAPRDWSGVGSCLVNHAFRRRSGVTLAGLAVELLGGGLDAQRHLLAEVMAMKARASHVVASCRRQGESLWVGVVRQLAPMLSHDVELAQSMRAREHAWRGAMRAYGWIAEAADGCR